MQLEWRWGVDCWSVSRDEICGLDWSRIYIKEGTLWPFCSEIEPASPGAQMPGDVLGTWSLLSALLMVSLSLSPHQTHEPLYVYEDCSGEASRHYKVFTALMFYYGNFYTYTQVENSIIIPLFHKFSFNDYQFMAHLVSTTYSYLHSLF